MKRRSVAIDEEVERLWDDHSRRFIFKASPDFIDKAACVFEILRGEVSEYCRHHVVSL